MLVQKVLIGVFAGLAAVCAVVAGVAELGSWVGLVAAEATGVLLGAAAGLAANLRSRVRAKQRRDAGMAQREADSSSASRLARQGSYSSGTPVHQWQAPQ